MFKYIFLFTITFNSLNQYWNDSSNYHNETPQRPYPNYQKNKPKKAICTLKSLKMKGTIKFTQNSPNSQTKITTEIKGLKKNTLIGYHIHEFGHLGNKCMLTGGHYNPFGNSHGGPHDYNRHVGDLGNLNIDYKGETFFEGFNDLVSLFGDYSVVGRAVVVHVGTDDLGQGNNASSSKSGNSGMRMFCCVIGLTN